MRASLRAERPSEVTWRASSISASSSLVISGVVIILVMFFIPSGIMGLAQKVPGLGRKGTLWGTDLAAAVHHAVFKHEGLDDLDAGPVDFAETL